MSTNATPQRAARRRWARPAIVVAVVLALLVAWRWLPLQEWLSSLIRWLDGLGPAAPMLLGLIYIVATVLFVPGFILTLGAGFLFGVVTGSIVVSIAATLGASAAFFIGRHLARDWIAGRIAGNRNFEAIDRAVAEQGWKIVLLTRLSPVFPFNLLNYAFGLTRVGAWSYILASWVGMLPATVLYVYLGSGLENLAAVAGGEREATTLERAYFWGGLAIAVAVVVFLTRVARRALHDALAENRTETNEAP